MKQLYTIKSISPGLYICKRVVPMQVSDTDRQMDRKKDTQINRWIETNKYAMQQL